MWVKIIKSEPGTWYADRIGDLFEVTEDIGLRGGLHSCK